MKYAVFFKTHKWDEIIETQYDLIKKSAQNGDVYILYDETSSKAPEHLTDVIKITHSNIEQIGLVDHGGFWYNGDYGGIIAFLSKPEYDFYVFSEYDVGVYHNLDNIIQIMINETIDIIGDEIIATNWVHEYGARPYYDVQIEKALFCIGFFSRRAVACLYARRLQQAELKKRNNIDSWPIGEAVMATEAKLSNLNYRELSDFCGNLDNYEWKEPLVQSYTKYIDTENTFIHPVCDMNKFIDLTFKTEFKINDKLLDKIERIGNNDLYIRAYNMKNNTESEKIEIYNKYVENIGDEKFEYVSENIISYGCKAYQSSLSPYSFSDSEAERVLNLLPRNHFSIHTMREENPWWLLDLGEECCISNIYVFDRPDIGGLRSLNLDVSISSDMNKWTSVYTKKDNSLIWNEKINIDYYARYVKVSILSLGMLHLDTIIVTGERGVSD